MLQQHKVKLIIAAVLFYFILVIANLPASQVINRLPLPSNVTLSGVSGTLWNGEMRSAMVNGIQVKDIAWKLSAGALLLGKASLDIKAGNARAPEQIAFNGLVEASLLSLNATAENAKLFLPTHLVLAQVPLPLPVQAGGRFYLDVSSLEYAVAESHCVAIQANGGWNNASVSGAMGMIDFGRFESAITCQDKVIHIQIDPNNVLGLDVLATLSGQGQVGVKGKFKPSTSLPQEVHQAARMFGRADSQGFYHISM